jgi:transcriptional regulator with XRE-family HTH domain
MARKRRESERQVHPTGPLETVDDTWKNDVRADMKREGWTQRDLASKIDVSEGAISNMFKPGPRQIRFKARIEALFRRETSPKLDEVRRRIDSKVRYLSLEDAERIAAIIDSLATRR